MKIKPKNYVFGVSLGKFLDLMINHRNTEANLDKIWAILDMYPPRNIKEVQWLTECVVVLGHFMFRYIDRC